MIYMWFTGLTYYKLAVEKDRDSVFTTDLIRPYGNQAFIQGVPKKSTLYRNLSYCC
jgi:hypothetical protein